LATRNTARQPPPGRLAVQALSPPGTARPASPGGQGPLIANTASKSILRAVVDAFVNNHPDHVTYFPAYEIVTVADDAPYEDDNRHVRPECVDRIMQLFEAWFVDDADQPVPAEATAQQADA